MLKMDKSTTVHETRALPSVLYSMLWVMEFPYLERMTMTQLMATDGDIHSPCPEGVLHIEGIVMTLEE